MYGLDTLISVSLYRFGLLAGIVMAVLGLASVFFLMPAVFSFWKNKTTVNPIKPENATTLVVDGVYKYSRNPMYVGMAAQLLAWAVYLANPFNFLVFALYVYVMTAIQIKPEEHALVKIFGASYREYCEQVRRWV